MIAEARKQPKYPMEEWVDKSWECFRMEYFVAITSGEEMDVAWGKDGLQKLVLGHLKGHMRKKMVLTRTSHHTQKLIPDGLQN